MKKFLIIAAAVGTVLASCAKTETVEVSDAKYIGFDAFIWNPTKAVTEVTTDNIKSFYVFGQKTPSSGQGATDIFDHEEVYESDTPNEWIYDNRQIWESGATYTFAAYSNGGSSRGNTITGADWDGTALTLTRYNAATEAKDLLVSIASNSANLTNANEPVQFNFQHALSMIKFTIKSELGDGDNAIKISEFKVTGIDAQADLSYNGTISWSNWTTPTDLNAADFETTTSKAGESEPFVVIPGEENIGFTVTFTATFADDETGTYKKELTATMSLQTFTAGYRYNYVATITGADMDVITFADPEVTPWTDTEVGISDLVAQ